MHKRRKQTAFDSRLLLAITMPIVVVIGILTLAGSIAKSIAGPNHPSLAQVIAWIIVGSFAATGIAIWRYLKLRNRSTHLRLPELLALTPQQFEETVGAILHDSGFTKIRTVGGSGDLAADLTALDPTGHTVVVQCKRRAPGTKIGSPDIQKFLGMTIVHHRASRGIFVTTSEFTQPAIQLAADHPIELWDGASLCRRIETLHRKDDVSSQANHR